MMGYHTQVMMCVRRGYARDNDCAPWSIIITVMPIVIIIGMCPPSAAVNGYQTMVPSVVRIKYVTKRCVNPTQIIQRRVTPPLAAAHQILRVQLPRETTTISFLTIPTWPQIQRLNSLSLS
eukprot:PhF_6_TR2182/c0_g1_i1/m.3589